jgi:ABC-type hemin transport system substrate-binding protein
VVGDLNRIDYERLVRLNPTHIVLQPPSTGIDAGLIRLATERGIVVRGWPHLDGVADIRRLVHELPGSVAGDGTVLNSRMAVRAAEIEAALDDLLDPRNKPRFSDDVMVIGRMNPVLAFGRGTYLDDVLSALGARNAVASRGWVQLSLEDVIRINPQVIVLVAGGASGGEPTDLSRLHDLPVGAAESGRVAVLRHPDALLPSSAIVEVAAALRRILVELNRVDTTAALPDTSATHAGTRPVVARGGPPV